MQTGTKLLDNHLPGGNSHSAWSRHPVVDHFPITAHLLTESQIFKNAKLALCYIHKDCFGIQTNPGFLWWNFLSCSRCRTDCTQSWCTRARPTQATTGHTSTTLSITVGWNTMTSRWPSRHGRSWWGTRSAATAMPARTASCTSTTRSHSSSRVITQKCMALNVITW